MQKEPWHQRLRRERINRTWRQSDLAERLHVAITTIQHWENGRHQPSAYFRVKLRALFGDSMWEAEGEDASFSSTLAESEEAEAGHVDGASQKELVDEARLPEVQSQTTHQLTGRADASVEPVLVEPESKPQVDWGDAPRGASFYGREQELAQLSRWMIEERCRVVSVRGMGGIGKSALTIHLMRKVASHFEVVIWRSLRDAPTCEALLDQCLQIIASQSLSVVPTSLERHLDLLLESLRTRRVLVVLDNLETLLEEAGDVGRMRAGYEGYSQLLHRVGEMEHQSCLLLTSREKAREITSLERKRVPVRTLHLAELDVDACDQLLAEKDLKGSMAERTQLIKAYTGNPLALNIVAQTIGDLFAGEIAPFLEQGELIFGEIRDLLAQQFTRLSLVEQTVLLWLATVREPISIEHLQALLVTPRSRAQILEALEALLHRSLIERGQHSGSFTLQSVVLEHATGQLIAEIASEIKHGQLSRFIEHGLELTTVKEYLRQTQQRLIVAPLLAEVRGTYPEQDEVEEHLLRLLDSLRTRADYAQGYGPANLLTLLREQRGHLRGLDLSRLSIRSAFLQGVEMQNTSLAGATLRDAVFTESFDAIRALAISSNGHFWATGSRRGHVQVWREGGKTLHLTWQAHTDTIRALAFSPDGATLATGSWDGTLKLWDLERGALLWTNWLATKIQRLAFAPNGWTLASGGGDAIIRLWDTTSGILLQTLPSQGSPVQALAWNPDGRLLASGSHNGSIWIWERPAEHTHANVQELAGHPTWVTELVFAPDGLTLASGSLDRTVKLWEVESGRCLQTLAGHTQSVFALAWSSDGCLLASSGRDHMIRLWDVEGGRYRAALHEHGAGVYAIAFTPESHHLLSSSDDGTLRLWDVERGLCVKNLQSYAVSLYDVAWSPDGTKIASAGTDTLVMIWDVESLTSPRILRGHSWVVHGVTWSPDGKMLASSGWDSTIRIWDTTTGASIQTVQDPDHVDALIFGVAWSPDGKWLAAASTIRGVQVWEVNTSTRRWMGQTNSATTRVVWSPDGTRLASCSDDGSVYIWDAASGVLQLQLAGHQGIVKSVAWSPDGKQLASGSGNQGQSDNGEIFVWDAHSGQRVHTFVGYPGVVSALAWAASGERLIAGSSDGMVRWWDVQRKECVRVRMAHQGAVQSLKTSPNECWLASCGDDHAIHIWDLEGGDLLRTRRRDRPYERLDISEVKGLTQAQKASLYALGASEDHPGSGIQCAL